MRGSRAILIAACSIIILVECHGSIAESDKLIARASIDKKTVNIGDRIRYSIDVRARKGTEVEFPRFENGKIGEFEIKDSGKGWHDLAVYSAGRHLIPPIEVRYRTARGEEWNIARTQELAVDVESVLPKDGPARDIRDIKGPISFSWRRRLFIIAFSLAVLSTLAIFIYKRLSGRKAAKLPHETALEELGRIRDFLSRGGAVKEYYIRMSDCVRRYIEESFRVRAPEMTTEEFLSSLKESDALLTAQKRLLEGFLSSCDLVKFAKYAPERNEAETVYTSAVKFVDETKPHPVP